jgi:3-oxoisoapionate decarboxylase
MKLGCICGSFNRTFDSGAMDLVGFLRRSATDLQVQGVELQDIHFPQTRPAYLQMIRRIARDLDLTIIGVAVHNDFGRTDPTLRQSEITKVKQWVEIAEQLGAPFVRVLAGFPEGKPEDRWPAMIAAFQDAAEFARQAGLRLGLENHDHGGFTPTAAQYLRILREVHSPALFPLLDTGGFTDGWTSVRQVIGIAEHVHAKFWELRPDGSDAKVDYGTIIPALRQAGYHDWMTFEYETPEPEDTGIPRALAYLKGRLNAA